MRELVELIKGGRSLEAKQLIDTLSDIPLISITSDVGGFEQHPLMATLFYGEFEVFQYILEKLPNIKEDLHLRFSANHRSINAAELPLVEGEKLKASHAILDCLYAQFTLNQLKESKLFNLAVFFMHEEMVDKFLVHESFVMFANQEGARSASPINLAASCYDLDERHRRNFNKLFANDKIKPALNSNKALALQLLDNGNFAAVHELLGAGYVLGIDSLPSLLNGLSRIPHEQSLVEKQKAEIKKLCEIIIGKADTSYLKFFCDKCGFFHPDIQEIFVYEVMSHFTKNNFILEDDYVFLNIVAVNENWLNGLKLSDANKKILQVRREQILSEVSKSKDIVSERKELLKTFDDEMSNASYVWYHTLRRGVENNETMPFGFPASDEEKRTEVLKRIFLTLGGCGLEIKKGDEWIPAHENGLPLAMEFTVGARVLFEIPATQNQKSTHAFFNWLTCGVAEREGIYNENISKQNTGSSAIADGKIIFIRPFATHGIRVAEDGHLQEEKLGNLFQSNTLGMLATGVINVVGIAENTGHFGMNFGAGKYGELDIHGKTIRADGSTGHLYICYKPPTTREVGGILVGIEGSEPIVTGQFGKHSLIGGSDALTVAGGRQSNELAMMEKGDAVIATRYNGRRVCLTNEIMAGLFKADLSAVKDVGLMAISKPANTIREFIAGLNQTISVQEKIPPRVIYTFERITSAHHALFIDNELKKQLLDVMKKLSLQRGDILALEELGALRAEYTKVFQNIINSFDAQKDFADVGLHKENFRKSIEEYLAALGRNQRHQLVFEVHKEVMQNEWLVLCGDSTTARAWNVGGYIWNTIVVNKEVGLGVGSRMNPTMLNNAIKDLCKQGSSGREFYVIDKKLIITNSAHDINSSVESPLLYAQCGGLNIADVLKNIFADAALKAQFLACDIDIIIPYVQALPYSNYMSSFTRGHYTMLHFRYINNELIITNYDSKSYYSGVIYPIAHIEPMIKEAIPEVTIIKMYSRNFGWQTVLDNRDCGRFVLAMLEHLINHDLESFSSVKPEVIIARVKELVCSDENRNVEYIVESLRFAADEESTKLKKRLSDCLIQLYTNTKAPAANEIKTLLGEYSVVLKAIITKGGFGSDAEKEFNVFRAQVERMLGASGRHRRLVGAYGVHSDVMYIQGWQRPEMVWVLPWNQKLGDFILTIAGQTLGLITNLGGVVIGYVGVLIGGPNLVETSASIANANTNTMAVKHLESVNYRAKESGSGITLFLQ